MGIGARRVFRLSLSTALALMVAYSLPLIMPFIAPAFGFMLAAPPKPAMGPKGLLGLLLVLCLMLGTGLLLIPVLNYYPATGLLLVLAGLFGANYISLNLGKGPVGALLTVGVAMISMVGTLSYALALVVIQELLICIAIGVLSHWLVYPLFPEDPGPAPQPPAPQPQQSRWLATRATLIVFPSFLLGLTNPTFYAPIIMKSVALGQQATETHARDAGRELLGSTFVAGLLAILFWFALKLAPTLWLFFLLTLAFGLFVTPRFYGVVSSRHPPTFWLNAMVTMFILIGPAVADSANGKDPYKAFVVRMSLFVGVTLYAWLAINFLEWLRARGQAKRPVAAVVEVSP